MEDDSDQREDARSSKKMCEHPLHAQWAPYGRHNFDLGLAFAEEGEQCGVELLRSLQGREVAYAFQDEKLCVWDVVGEVFGVFVQDELVVFGLHDEDWHADSG
jgi:hypothetical protein